MKKSGFILPLTIIIIFAIAILVIHMLTRSSSISPFQHMIFDREKAKQIALMGVTIAQAQLTGPFKTDKQKQTWYKDFFKHLNMWQNFKLTYEADGINAEIQIYVSCEQGKIPINALWNFKDKKFVTSIDVKKLLNTIYFATGQRQEGKVITELEAIFKLFEQPLEDLTNLFVNNYFKGLGFHWLPQPPEKEQRVNGTQEVLLSDIFTIGTTESKINPLFLTPGMKKLFELNKGDQKPKEQDEALKKLVEGIKDSIDWKTNWDKLLEPLYGKRYENLPKPFTQLLDTSSRASLISVVSYGKVGSVTQKVLALLDQNLEANDRVTYTIQKLYWI